MDIKTLKTRFENFSDVIIKSDLGAFMADLIDVVYEQQRNIEILKTRISEIERENILRF